MTKLQSEIRRSGEVRMAKGSELEAGFYFIDFFNSTLQVLNQASNSTESPAGSHGRKRCRGNDRANGLIFSSAASGRLCLSVVGESCHCKQRQHMNGPIVLIYHSDGSVLRRERNKVAVRHLVRASVSKTHGERHAFGDHGFDLFACHSGIVLSVPVLSMSCAGRFVIRHSSFVIAAQRVHIPMI